MDMKSGCRGPEKTDASLAVGDAGSEAIPSRKEREMQSVRWRSKLRPLASAQAVGN